MRGVPGTVTCVSWLSCSEAVADTGVTSLCHRPPSAAQPKPTPHFGLEPGAQLQENHPGKASHRLRPLPVIGGC